MDEKLAAVNVEPFAYACSLFNGKWKMHILFWLWKKEVLRYGELKKSPGKGNTQNVIPAA